jgi:hypothetical protein
MNNSLDDTHDPARRSFVEAANQSSLPKRSSSPNRNVAFGSPRSTPLTSRI